MTLLTQIEQILKLILGGGLVVAAFYGLHLVNEIRILKRRNQINEIDLTAHKIISDVNAKPLDDLIAESNKSHGARSVVKDSGDDSQEK